MMEKIIIVDDEPDILNILSNILSENEYVIRTASGGKQALQLYQSEPCGLIISDMKMPGMEGLELMRRIKDIDEDTEFIILTGYASVDNAIAAMREDGAFDYLTKPLDDIDLLVTTVDRALERRRLRKKNKDLVQELITKQKELEENNSWLRAEIEERKKVEKALSESEQQYRKLYDSVNDYIFTHDAEGRFISVNQATIENLGYTIDEMTRRPVADFMLPRYQEAFYEEYLTEIKKKGSYEGVSVYLTSGGDKHYVEYRNKFVGREGKEPYISGVGRDITERIKSQKEMRVLERQVQQAQKMEAIGTLAGGIAHNFNNILMGIQGYISLMLLETDPDHPFHEKLRNVEKLVQNGSKLSGQLLGYAREGKYEVKPINLNDVIQETLDTFGATRKDITIHREFAESIFGVKADKAQIEQILFNLYVNAADSMPRGGNLYLKTMNVTHADIANKPYKVKPGNYVLMTVRDTGKGMDKETMQRIFEPFFTTKGLAKGTGLGLASVYGIVKSHGGYIDVESEMGGGSTFNIYLPTSEKVVMEQVSGYGEVERGKETILLVDDEELVLDASAQLIKAIGYRVLKAKSGSEAIKVYKENKETIDLVILDVVMPEMSGGETYDRLKEVDSEVVVLLCSGYSLNGEATEIIRRGGAGFIQKPFNVDVLSKKLRNILDKD
jgi:PAS domain S-box-containing protein